MLVLTPDVSTSLHHCNSIAAIGSFLSNWLVRLVLGLALLGVTATAAQAQTADLTITTAGPNSANGLDTFDYTLTIINNGLADASGASFDDTFPAGATNIAATCAPLDATGGASCPASFTINATDVTGTIPSLPINGKVVLHITGNFPVSGPSSLSNAATVATPAGVTETDPSTNTSFISVAMTYTYVADLAATKTQSSPAITFGTPITYTLTLSNNGPDPADGAFINDTLSATTSNGTTIALTGIHIVSCTTTGGAVCPTLSDSGPTGGGLPDSPSTTGTPGISGNSIPTFPGNSSVTIVYEATYGLIQQPCYTGGVATTSGTVINALQIYTPFSGATYSDPNNANNNAQVQASVSYPALSDCPQTDLAVSKSQDLNSIAPGQPITYTVTFTNTGADVDGSTIGEGLSAALTNGTNISLTDVKIIDCTATNGAVCPPALADSSGLQFYNLPCCGSNLGVPNVGQTQIPTFPSSSSITLTFQATFAVQQLACTPGGNPATATTITNQASIFPPLFTTDTNFGNNAAQVSTTITYPAVPDCPHADIAVTKTQNSNTIVPGQPITYTATFTNNGPDTADGQFITDGLYMPSGSNMEITNVHVVSCDTTGGAACPALSDSGPLAFNFIPSDCCGNSYTGMPSINGTTIPTLPSGASFTIVYQATYAGCAASASISNFATVYPSFQLTDPDQNNNRETATANVQACADISVNKTVAPTTVSNGSAGTYTITISNAGPGDATNIAFSDPLPSTDGFIRTNENCTVLSGAATCGALSFDANSNTVSGVMTDIPAGGALQITINGTGGIAAGTYMNTACAQPGDYYDPVASTNCSQVNVNIANTQSPITITKTIVGGPAGGLPAPLTFTGTVRCTSQPAQQWSATVNAGATSGSSSALPFYDGDSCTIDEDATPAPPTNYAWSGSPTISPSSIVSLGPTTPVSASVTNTLVRQNSNIAISKTVSGAPIGGVSTTFDFTVDCTASGDGSYSASIVLSNATSGNTSVVVPAGANCTMSETAPSAASAPANYQWGAAPPSVNVTTTTAGPNSAGFLNSLSRQSSTISINKTVSGGPGGVTATFAFNIDCSATGDGTYPGSISLNNATSGSVNVSVPAGATCKVSETAPSAASAPTNYQWSATPGSVTLTTTATGPNPAAFANTLIQQTSDLVINKTVNGAPNGGVTATFAFTAACGAAGNFSGNVALSAATSGSTTITGIPAGSVCTVAETAPSAASAPVNYQWGATPADANVTTTQSGPNIANFTNNLTRQSSAVTISKTVSGGPAAGVTASFDFAVNCSASGDGSFTGSVALNAATSGSSSVSVPAGAKCTVSETAPSAASAPTGYNWGTTPGAVSLTTTQAGPNNAGFTNTLTRGTSTLTINKTVTGGPAAGVTATFNFGIDCSASGDGSFTGNVALNAATSGSSSVSVPAGAKCAVSETTPSAASAPNGYAWGTTPGAVSVSTTQAGPNAASFTNILTALDPPFFLTKTVSGGPASGVTGSFSFNIDCGAVGTFTQTVSLSDATSGSISIDNIPFGTSCTFSEASNLPTPPAGFTWGTPPAAQTIRITGTAVNFVNGLNPTQVPTDPPVAAPIDARWMLILIAVLLGMVASPQLPRTRRQ